MTDWKKINRAVGKVTCALIELNCYSFKFRKYDNYVEIDIIEFVLSPYNVIRVFEDTINYCDTYNNAAYREGRNYGKHLIKKDILNKE